MSKRLQHTAFGMSHPVVPALYVAVTLGLTMVSMEPVLVACSLMGALAYVLCELGPRACLDGLRFQLPLVLLVALVNPLFVSQGSTVLFSIFGRAVFLESVAYGCVHGALLMATVLWFSAANLMLSFEHVLSLLGNRLPTLALMLSMMLRLVPRLVRRGSEIAAVQDVALSCIGDSDPAVLPGTARRRLRQSSVLMGWTMEDSLETADAMRARGWSSEPRRTTYQRYRFTSGDALACAALVFAGLLCALLAWTATARFSFYPVLGHVGPWWGYLPYAAWMLAPTALHCREERRFR